MITKRATPSQNFSLKNQFHKSQLPKIMFCIVISNFLIQFTLNGGMLFKCRNILSNGTIAANHR